MKLAFLFLTRNNLNQEELWQRFFESGSSNQFSVYCHPKNPDEVTSTLLRQAIISHLIATAHGDISLVRATRLLLSEARSDPLNEYFLLLSESCIPLYPFSAIYQAVTLKPISYIGWWNSPGQETTDRWSTLPAGFIPRDRFFKQHQWMILHRDAVDAILASDYTPAFERMHVPDEHYFISSLLKDDYDVERKVTRAITTFVNWQEPEVEGGVYEDGRLVRAKVIRPKTYEILEENILETARKMGCLFFRKVSTSCDCSRVLQAL